MLFAKKLAVGRVQSVWMVVIIMMQSLCTDTLCKTLKQRRQRSADAMC